MDVTLGQNMLPFWSSILFSMHFIIRHAWNYFMSNYSEHFDIIQFDFSGNQIIVQI